jgi:tRNA (cytidine/uridine-2'-O-)-methyltransferase
MVVTAFILSPPFAPGPTGCTRSAAACNAPAAPPGGGQRTSAPPGPASRNCKQSNERPIGRDLLAPLHQECKWAAMQRATTPSNTFACRALCRLTAGATKRRQEQHWDMRIALFQPDIPQNTGTILRLAACLDIEAHIIEPCGFPTTDRAFRRAGMDYLDRVRLERHHSWAAFEDWRRDVRTRLVLFSTHATQSYLDHPFEPDDILLFGRESAGVPDEVRKAVDVALVIPMAHGLRSLNVAMAAAMAVGEALRQTRGRIGAGACRRSDREVLS